MVGVWARSFGGKIMLTAKENMRQVILGGNPDRLVNQYEAINLLFHPFMLTSPLLKPGDPDIVNPWGITFSLTLSSRKSAESVIIKTFYKQFEILFSNLIPFHFFFA